MNKTITNAYNADGTRLVRQATEITDDAPVIDDTTLYLHDGTELRNGSLFSNTTIRRFTTPTGTPVATVSQGPTTNPSWDVLFADGQDTVRLDATRNVGSFNTVLTRPVYYPYGQYTQDGALGVPGDRGYLDKQLDPTGDLRLDERDYTPELDQLTTPDPILTPGDPLSANPYTYARNNPIASSDPSGLDCRYSGKCHLDTQPLGPADTQLPAGTDTAETGSDDDGSFGSGLTSGAGAGSKELLAALNPTAILSGLKSMFTHPPSPWDFVKSVVTSITHADDLKAIYDAWRDGDAYGAGYNLGKFLVGAGTDLVATILGSEVAKLFTAAVKDAKRVGNAAIDLSPPLSIGSKQFGAKWGKHAEDYGLDPGSSASRTWFLNRAREVHLNPDEVRRGAWNPAGGGGKNYFFFRQGEDLLITKPGGEFVTMFPGGSTNAWFKSAEVFLQ